METSTEEEKVEKGELVLGVQGVFVVPFEAAEVATRTQYRETVKPCKFTVVVLNRTHLRRQWGGSAF